MIVIDSNHYLNRYHNSTYDDVDNVYGNEDENDVFEKDDDDRYNHRYYSYYLMMYYLCNYLLHRCRDMLMGDMLLHFHC